MKISAIYVSPGHNFFGRYGKPAGEHATHAVTEVECVAGRGLRGDRFWDYKRDYAGQVTFFDEAVHRRVLASLRPSPRSAAAYRRNVLTRGVDLMSLAGQEFEVQGVRFLGMGESKPCAWMEQAVAPGAENFLRGDGGLRARILSDGVLRVDCATAAGVLLAGGRSRRMGEDKVQVSWQGQSLGDHQAATLIDTGSWPLLLACRAGQSWTPAGFNRVEDRTADGGVLGALLEVWGATDAEVLTVLAVDLPRVPAAWLETVSGLAREAKVSVVPFHAGRFEPLAAAWHRSASAELESAVVAGRSLQEVCASLGDAGRLQPWVPQKGEGEYLANVNTPEELAHATAAAANASLDAARSGFLPRRLPNG